MLVKEQEAEPKGKYPVIFFSLSQTLEKHIEFDFNSSTPR